LAQQRRWGPNLKRRLIMHLGLSKTGTTSIQAFLRRNPDVLAHGVSYPDLGGEVSNHPALAPSTLRPDASRAVSHEALALEIRQRGRASFANATNTPLWSGVFERVNAGNAHTVIISYENLYFRPDLYRFALISDYLKSFDVHGIIYLRSQEDWLTSLYGQTVRGRSRLKTSFAEFIESRRRYLSYSTVIDDIVTHIPLDNITVAVFDEVSASGLLPDFFERIGLSRDALGAMPEQGRANPSPPHWAMLFMLRCNQAAITDEAFVRIRRALGKMTAEESPRVRPGLDLATPEERQSLREAAGADADRLKRRYGVEIPPRIRDPVSFRHLDDEDIAAIRSALAAKLPRSALKALEAL
jgi:hypothetical protein